MQSGTEPQTGVHNLLTTLVLVFAFAYLFLLLVVVLADAWRPRRAPQQQQ
jgi:hypothetical protein